jgi:hypothetical protein
MASSENVFCKVSRVRLDAAGYTSTGRYFGTGEPLFCAEQWDDTGFWREEYFREVNYQTARARCKAIGWKVSR